MFWKKLRDNLYFKIIRRFCSKEDANILNADIINQVKLIWKNLNWHDNLFLSHNSDSLLVDDGIMYYERSFFSFPYR